MILSSVFTLTLCSRYSPSPKGLLAAHEAIVSNRIPVAVAAKIWSVHLNTLRAANSFLSFSHVQPFESCLILPFSEDGGSDAYHRGTALYGYRIVVAHAPTAMLEVFLVSEIVCLYFVEEVGCGEHFFPDL